MIEDLNKNVAEVDYTKRAGSRSLFNLNPLQKRNNKFYQNKVVRELPVSKFKLVVDDRKRKVLINLAERYKVSEKKVLPLEALYEVPFKRVRLKVPAVGEDKVVRLNNNWFKVSTYTNIAVGLFYDKADKLRAEPIKNPRIYKRPDHSPDKEYVKVFRVGTEVDIYDYKKCGKPIMRGMLRWIHNKAPYYYLNVVDLDDEREYKAINPKHLIKF